MASLLGLARAEQERAKRLLRNRLYAHGVTLLLGLLSLSLAEPWVYVAAALAVGSESAAWWLRSIGLEAHILAETGRRRALVSKEMGRDIDVIGTALLTTEFSGWARARAAEWDDPDYYATDGPPGLRAACAPRRPGSRPACRARRPPMGRAVHEQAVAQRHPAEAELAFGDRTQGRSLLGSSWKKLAATPRSRTSMRSSSEWISGQVS